MGKLVNLIGQTFGRLTVVERGPNDKHKRAQWWCRCSCDDQQLVLKRGNDLQSNRVQSCGCWRSESTVIRSTSHGETNTRLYQIWHNMKNRCYNQNDPYYECYGGRGITVCDEWKESYENFSSWAICNGYNDTLTIERKNVDGNYCSENCTWATQRTQANNRRNNHYITYNGERHTIAEWEIILKLNTGTIKNRIKLGWDTDKIFNTPIKKYKLREKGEDNDKNKT